MCVKDDDVKRLNEHINSPSKITCKVVRLKSQMKYRAETRRDAPRQILADTLANVSETTEINLQRIENLRRTIHSFPKTRS